jgi:hypothetical protein
MAHTPDRPFVPERTPSPPRMAVSASAFRLARPFVHGAKESERLTANRPAADRLTANRAAAAQVPPSFPPVRPAPPPLPLVYDPPVDTAPPVEVKTHSYSLDAFIAPNAAAESEPLAPIAQYLETEPRNSLEFNEESYELPPVEQFMDTLPEGTGVESGPNGEPMTQSPMFFQGDVAPEDSDWGDTDWQRYDWRSAASLGEGTESEARTAWSETDWENAATPVKEIRETAAKAIADALDGIARRIRDGELVIPSPGSVADPAAIAATLAALLGVRR